MRMLLQVPNGNYEYYLGDRCWRQLTGTAGIPLDPPLNMSPHLSPTDLLVMRQASFVYCDQFVIREERETYASYWANKTYEVGHLLIDSHRMGNIDLFGPTALRAGRREMLPIHHLRDPPPMSSFYDTEELWPLTHGMQRLALAEAARDAQTNQDLTDKNVALIRNMDSLNDQLYSHNLHLRRGNEVRAVPLPPGGGARTRQGTREHGPRTRGIGSSRKG
ncbi:hypothetical protein GIB67_020971 [Kingdonia uniflora]|uniref:Uncharacterized protein n=1 Tax=Kingdonia uniflora TaxID=39325 RepID=A0A7J7M813_9MAGN|nr:hypothetical protein GIB67_020971 [Kingdonia uniflora]